MGRAIFLSYGSDEARLAERLELSLEAAGHSVFRDRSELRPGEAFDARIRDAVEASDLFIFLITPRSVADGRYARAELTFAQHRWPHPEGHVLPVVVAPTPLTDIPEYLKAVTLLEPRGEVAAEVLAAVERMALPWHGRWRRPGRLAAAGIVLAAAVGLAWLGLARAQEARLRQTAIAADLRAARAHEEAGNYAAAWSTLEKTAEGPAGGDASVVEARERLAMHWLQNIRGSQLSGNFRDIVDKVSPVVAEGAAGTGPRAADLRAHLGWAEFLRGREGVGGLNPAAHYTRAIEMDRANLYAHTMLAFHLLTSAGASRAIAALPEARGHFAAALESGRERAFVRRMQCAALLWYSGQPALEIEVVRAAGAIRAAGEPMPAWPGAATLADRLWPTYYDRLVLGHDTAAFLEALPPRDHLATFTWLYPEASFGKPRFQYLAALEPLQAHAGNRAAALATARELLETMIREGDGRGPLATRARAAIARLSGP